MSIGKREITMIAVLGGIIYLFIGFNFIWLDFFSELDKVNKESTSVTDERDKLAKDIENSSSIQKEMNSKVLLSEKMNDYVADNVNAINCIEYLKKMSENIDGDIRDIKINMPEILTVGEDSKNSKNKNNEKPKEGAKTYFGIKVDFEAILKQPEIATLVNYIEGSSRKTSISNFGLTAIGADDRKKEQFEEGTFKIKVSFVMYASGNAEKDADYGKYRLNEYGETSEFPYSATDLQKLKKDLEDATKKGITKETATPTPEPEVKQTPQKTPSPSGSSDKKTTEGISMNEDSYHIAGENLRIYGFNRYSDNIYLKTNQKENIKINFKGMYYTINVSNDSGRLRSIDGSLPLEDIIQLNISVADTKADIDKDLGMNVTIVNESDKKINLKLTDKMGRVYVYDRDQKRIIISNSQENVYVS